MVLGENSETISFRFVGLFKADYQCKVSGGNEHVFEMASVESFRMKKVESVEKEASAWGRKSIYLYFLNY